jgi:hypothetical protein
MLVTFQGAAANINAAASDDGATRQIMGTAVPWDTVGTVSDGTRVRFARGSLAETDRPIVTLGHDGPPIGRTAANRATDAGMETTVRVSRTRDGDESLILAADGVLGMFSVGVNPTTFHYDDDGVMVVDAGEWQHTALLPFGAFAAAVVTDVAASAPIPNRGETMSDTLTTDPPSVDVTAQAAQLAAAQTAASWTAVPLSTSPRPARPSLTLARVAQLVAGANRGEMTTEAVRAELAAALADITTTGAGPVIQPAYRSEVAGLIDHGTPLLQAIASAPLPASGMTIEYPEWQTFPQTGRQMAEKTQIVSQAATMALKSRPVITIAGGNDISLQAVERSSPSFLEAYLRAASVDWARKAEGYVIGELLAVAEAVTPGADFLANIQALIGALDPAVTPAGPLFVAMATNVAIPLISVPVNEGPAYWNGRINFSSMTSTVDGDGMPLMFVDWNLPADTMLAGSRQAATWYQSAGAPADIRVVDVSLLGLDVGVYGYGALTIEYPGALAKMDLTP